MYKRFLLWIKREKAAQAAPCTVAAQEVGQQGHIEGSEGYYAKLLHNIEIYDGTERGQRSLAENN